MMWKKSIMPHDMGKDRWTALWFLRSVLFSGITLVVVAAAAIPATTPADTTTTTIIISSTFIRNGCKNSYSVKLHIVFEIENGSPACHISVASGLHEPLLHYSSSLSVLSSELEESYWWLVKFSLIIINGYFFFWIYRHVTNICTFRWSGHG